MLEQFSATVDKIYAAAAGLMPWDEALHGVEDLTQTAGAVVNLVPRIPVAPRTLAGGFTQDQCAEYERDYMPICRRIRYGIDHPGETQYDYLFISEAEMDRDPVYQWFGKHGLRYHVGSYLGSTASYHVAFGLQRTHRQGHAEPADIALFNLIKPHIARACGLADRLGTLRSYQRFSSAMLEALPQSIFALDVGGRMLFANGAGAALLAQSDGLALVEGRLGTAQPAEQPVLDGMIRGAIVLLGEHSRGWTLVSRPSGKLPYAVFISPLNVSDEELTAAEAKVLVMVYDTGEHRSADPEMLTSLYGLTETEARLASALSGGHSIQSAAALLHMQPSTARAHLKHVFAKVGVNRQQDLVRLLTSLSAAAH